MADDGTRLRVGIVGTSTIGRIRVNLCAEETAVRAELVTKDLEPRGWYIGKIKLYALRRLRSVQEGMPLSQLPRQVYQEGDRQCAGGRRGAGAHKGQLRARRVVAPTRAVGGVSARAGRSVCVQFRSDLQARWCDGRCQSAMPHTRFAKNRACGAHNFRNWLS